MCYDDTSFVEIVPPLPDQYIVYWQLDSILEGPYLEGQPGIYQAEVIELFSGCSQEIDVQIPGPPPLSANFSTIPNQSCVDIIDNTVQLIDLSSGATEGWIDFGDGSAPVPYVQGELIQHDYDLLGDFLITLIVTNELGCVDTISRQICVENKVLLYVPNIFSPNGDGSNDVFTIEVYGVKELVWSIFSRWGEKVFEGLAAEAYWDGTFNGKPMDPGVFAVQVRYTDLATGETGERISTVTLVR